MKNDESKLQQACIKWFRLAYPNYILFAIPNGGARNIVTASIMKGEGVLAGVPDLFLAYPKLQSAGLFIEMKTPKGVLNDNQKKIFPELRKAGYRVEVCRTFEDFKNLITEYVGK